MANSSKFQDEIVDLVVESMPCVEDFVRSKSWKSAVAIAREHNPIFAPCLMLASYDEKHRQEPIQSFFNLSTKRIFNLHLPQTQGRKCWGSPFGWLVTIGLDLNIHLFNPFSTMQLSLPAQTTFPDQYDFTRKPKHLRNAFVYKFALSSNPSADPGQSCVVMAICEEKRELYFAKPGDEAWTSLGDHTSCFQDVIFFEGQFYAVCRQGILRVCEINTPLPKAKPIATPPEDLDDDNKFYLVEFAGDLHLVERLVGYHDAPSVRDCYHFTESFEVHKFDFHDKSWTEVEDLRDYSLFLGNGMSFSISISDYPGFKRNCIYFTDDHTDFYRNEFCDMGVYDMEEGTFESIYSGNDMVSKFSRPFFIMPDHAHKEVPNS